jgi:hypothetical protein
MLTPNQIKEIELQLKFSCPSLSHCPAREYMTALDTLHNEVDIIGVEEYFNKTCIFLLLVLESEGA